MTGKLDWVLISLCRLRNTFFYHTKLSQQSLCFLSTFIRHKLFLFNKKKGCFENFIQVNIKCELQLFVFTERTRKQIIKNLYNKNLNKKTNAI